MHTGVKLCNPRLSTANVLAPPYRNRDDHDHDHVDDHDDYHDDDDDDDDYYYYDYHDDDDNDHHHHHHYCKCTCTSFLQYSLKLQPPSRAFSFQQNKLAKLRRCPSRVHFEKYSLEKLQKRAERAIFNLRKTYPDPKMKIIGTEKLELIKLEKN